MRGLIRKGWTVLLGAALLTCAFGAHTVHAEDLTGGNTPQGQEQTGSEAAQQQPAAVFSPAQPTDPQPSDPAQPTDPAQPADPSAALQTTDPADPNGQDPAQTTDPADPAQQPADPSAALRTTDPADPNGQDPAQQDPQPAPDTFITAEVYARLGGELPAVIQTNGDSAEYSGMLFTVRINLSELERRLSAAGLPANYVDGQGRIYYSHEASGLSGPYVFWNDYVLPCVDASQQSLFSKEGMQAYLTAEEGRFVGYVLKREKYANDHYHLDGIIEPSVTGVQGPPPAQPKPVTAENYPKLLITTNVWNAARNNPSPSHADLAVRGEVFTYELKTTLPDADTAAWVNRFVIEDTLVEELTFAGAATVLVNGQQVALPAQAVEQSGQSLVVDLPKEFLASNAGNEICVSFGVKIRDGVSLARFASAANGGRAKVPNSCSYHVWLHEEESGPRRLPSERDPDVSEFSGVATVTPPATDIRLEETVNGRRTDGGAVMLGSRYEEVTYTIRAYVLERADMRSLSISNTIAGVMEFRGGVEVMIGGILTEGLVQIFDKTLVVSVPEKYLTDEALKQPITVSFRAAIISGSDLTA
ncbi:MAG: isopeptide-forming domain-containing fimbrial protein, partial [Lachnospiraceae bacterium]|nr:isopeptide-forming domain-containing fimbrial protein [Lachnospiraceae bacterium]